MSLKIFEIDYSSLQVKEIGSWPIYLRVLIVLACNLVMLFIIYYCCIAYSWQIYLRNKLMVVDKKSELAMLLERSIQLDKFKQEIIALQNIYSACFNNLPALKIATALEQISYVLEGNNLKTNFIKIDEPGVSNIYRIYALNLSVNGDYHEIAEFLGALKMAMPLLQVKEFTINNRVLNLNLNVYIELINDVVTVPKKSATRNIHYHGKNFRAPFTGSQSNQVIANSDLIVGSISNGKCKYAIVKQSNGNLRMEKLDA